MRSSQDAYFAYDLKSGHARPKIAKCGNEKLPKMRSAQDAKFVLSSFAHYLTFWQVPECAKLGTTSLGAYALVVSYSPIQESDCDPFCFMIMIMLVTVRQDSSILPLHQWTLLSKQRTLHERIWEQPDLLWRP